MATLAGLRPAQRDVDILERFTSTAVIVGKTQQAHCRRNHQLVAADLEWFSKQTQQRLRVQVRFISQKCEDIAGNTGDSLTLSKSTRYSLGDCTQQQVSIPVSERIIDFGKMIQVDQRKNLAGDRPSRDAFIQKRHKMPPVWQGDKLIVESIFVQLFEQSNIIKPNGNVGGKDLQELPVNLVGHRHLVNECRRIR